MIASSDLNPQITRINFRKFLPPEARTDQRQGFTLTLTYSYCTTLRQMHMKRSPLIPSSFGLWWRNAS